MYRKLPIGLQDFRQVIENDYIYVDKTRYIYELVSTQRVYFLSRPRRFGKSLTVSTLKHLFLGNKELFRNTFIYNKWDFKPHKVLHISLGSIKASNIETLKKALLSELNFLAQDHNIQDYETTGEPSIDFKSLLRKMGNDTVVLIDEYDKPILSNFENPDIDDMVRELKSFYSVLKDASEFLRFIFLTGISKFSKVGIFSELNNLNDISVSDRYASLAGITEQELISVFSDYIKTGSETLGIQQKALIQEIKEYYNGFSFNGKDFLYNPFSILNFFNDFTFRNYWFESGSSSFIAEYSKKHNLSGLDMENVIVSQDIFSSYEIYNAPPVSFLTQAGYLTIKQVSEGYYNLDFPNKEVKQSFYRLLLPMYFNYNDITFTGVLGKSIIESLRITDFDKFLSSLQSMFASIPAEHFKNLKYRESFFHTHLYILLTSLGLTTFMEKQHSKGKSDLIIKFNNNYFIIEIKEDLPSKSIEQIKDKGYYTEFREKPGSIFLIGLQTSIEQRNFVDIKAEMV